MKGKDARPLLAGHGSYLWAALRFWERATGARMVMRFAKDTGGSDAEPGDSDPEGDDADDPPAEDDEETGDDQDKDDDESQDDAGGSQSGAGKDRDSKYLREELRKATRERSMAREETRRLKAQLDELSREKRKREDDERRAAEEKEQKELEEKRAYDEALKRERERSAEEIRKRDERLRSIAMDSVRDKIAASVASIDGVVGEAVPEIAMLLESHIGFDENDKPFVKDDRGNPRRQPDDPAKPFTIKDLAREYVGARPWFLKDRAPQGSRTGFSESADGRVWNMERAVKDIAYNNEWKKADPEGHAKAWREYNEAIANKEIPGH